jgi:hypothetical protein
MMRRNNIMIALLGCLCGIVAASAALADGHTLHNARLSILFGSSSTGYTTNDADRVDAISWLNSAGAPVTNYVAVGGPTHCGDPQEFFGEAYGDSGDTGVPLPNIVIGGVTSTWIGTGARKGTTAIKSLTSCDETLDAKTATHYALPAGATLVNALMVARTFKFAPHPAAGNLRAYVARLRLGIYPSVLAPNAAGVVQTYAAANCPLNCTVSDWNGKWMADDDGNGNGVAIFRDPATNPPAQLTVDWDGYSSSNNTAITLTMPTGGFHGTLTETEYLCFYDATSWPLKARNKGTPPKGCAGVPH